MDLKVETTNGEYDLIEQDGDLLEEFGLHTAVLDSVLSDRRAEPTDDIPDGTTDRRGFWGDSIAEVEGDRWGSRRWLLERSKATDDVLGDEEDYAQEALKWMVEDGIATSVETSAAWIAPEVLCLSIIIHLVEGGVFEMQIEYEIGVNNGT